MSVSQGLTSELRSFDSQVAELLPELTHCDLRESFWLWQIPIFTKHIVLELNQGIATRNMLRKQLTVMILKLKDRKEQY